MGRSKVYAINRERFTEIVKNSNSKNEILIKLGMRAAGGNFKTLTRRLKEEGLLNELSEKTRKHLRNVLWNVRKRNTIPLDDILKENTNYERKQLKIRLFKAGKLLNKCAICGIGPEWNGRALTLQIDHINGIHNDNRLQNLRILCPNCHSQTDTYVGKATRRGLKKYLGNKRNKCIMCSLPAAIGSKSGLCRKCFDIKRRKVIRPDEESLLNMVNDSGYCATGRKLGVSDNAVRKWLKVK